MLSSTFWCEVCRLTLRSCYLVQHAGRIVQAGVSRLDVGGQSLPLRQIFLAFISNHLQRNSEPKGSAYGFQGTLVEFEVGKNVGLLQRLAKIFH